MKKKKSSRPINALNAFCSFSLLMALVYAFFVGFGYMVTGVMVVSVIVVAVPSFLASNGIVDALMGTVMALVEGIVVIVETIVSSISSLFP